MMNKVVSIIVGEYNSESFIEKNVRSLLNQTYKNIEILLYDDASTDSTREIMKKIQAEFSDKIRIFYSDENKGVGYGRNYCLAQAKGEYVLFMDHDDYIHDSYVERVLKFAEKNPDYDIVYLPVLMIMAKADISGDLKIKKWPCGKVFHCSRSSIKGNF